MRQGLQALLLASALGGAVLPAIQSGAQELVIPEVTYPSLPKRAASANGFVPSGWVLETQASGDLNKDGVADIAFVLRQNDPKNVVTDPERDWRSVNTNPRILAVAFREETVDDYALRAENRTLIPRQEDPEQEDPFDGIAIERGGLRVVLRHFMVAGGWETFTATHVLQHRAGRFELIGYDRNQTHRSSGKTRHISLNYLIGKMKISTGNIDLDNPTKVSWKDLPRSPSPTLESIGDGLAFDPEARSSRR